MLKRRGFSLVEVIVLVALIAIGASVLVPALAAANSRRYAEQTAAILAELSGDIDDFEARLDEWPGRLSSLSQPPSTAMPDACTPGVNYTNAEVGNWNNLDAQYGPFYRKQVIGPLKGFPLPGGFGQLEDTLRATTQAANADLPIIITSVVEADAADLDLIVDGTANASTGLLRYGAASQGVVTVKYHKLIAEDNC